MALVPIHNSYHWGLVVMHEQYDFGALGVIWTYCCLLPNLMGGCEVPECTPDCVAVAVRCLPRPSLRGFFGESALGGWAIT